MAPDDFYIGYDTPVPPGSRRLVGGAIAMALALSAGLAAMLVAGQRPFAVSSFAFGDVRAWTGIVRVDSADAPEPRLDSGDGGFLLVAPGKHGAAHLVRPFRNRAVRLSGTLIARDGHRMLQVEPGSIQRLDAHAPDRVGDGPRLSDLGKRTLTGEIVDAKCYLGVMNPGEGTVHRDCAGVCIRGGIPAMLAVRMTDGRTRLILIVGADGGALSGDGLHARAAQLAGRPVEVAGRLLAGAAGDWRLAVTRIDPAPSR